MQRTLFVRLPQKWEKGLIPPALRNKRLISLYLKAFFIFQKLANFFLQ